MKLSPPLAAVVVVAALSMCAFPQVLRAQIRDNGPASLIITYKSAPSKRAEFRAYMESKGAAQFARWRTDGVFRECRILFSSYVVNGGIDMAVILDFDTFAASGRWKEIERKCPGGIAPDGLALGVPDDTILAYPLDRAEAPRRDPTRSAFVLAPYQVTVDMAKYEAYARGYVVPQLKGWIADGALASYAVYIRQPYQNPEGRAWTSLLVLEYSDMSALARSNIVKDEVRKRLAANPEWKAFSDNKQEMRKAQGFLFLDAIVAPDNAGR